MLPKPLRAKLFVASRGTTPILAGSRWADAAVLPSIGEEGVLIDNCWWTAAVCARELLERWTGATRRNPAQNSRIRAQIAANATGGAEPKSLVAKYGVAMMVYMQRVQDNAEESVRGAITALKDGRYTLPLDNGARIQVSVRIDPKLRAACIDFTGSSAQLRDNFNAPRAITTAAVLYVFRTLVNDEIPLNEGCLRPLQLILPEDCMLNPRSPAAVVAGNVETSTCVTNALYGAPGRDGGQSVHHEQLHLRQQPLPVLRNHRPLFRRRPEFNGTSVVQTHMTNSRMTDPESWSSDTPCAWVI